MKFHLFFGFPLRAFWVAAFVLRLTEFQTVRADDWPYYQHDPQHSGDSSVSVDPTALSLTWSAPSGFSDPLIVSGSVFASLTSNTMASVDSFNLATGAVNWSYSQSFAISSHAAVGGGFVAFVGTNNLSGGGSLNVLNSSTGAFLYSVAIPEGLGSVMPTVVQDPVSHATTAYVANSSTVSAISLGASSGSVLWSQAGSFGGQSIPTVVGNSIVLAGPGQYYAFDQATGTMNHFQNGLIGGGGGVTVAYDATRKQLYVLAFYNGTTPTLSAYKYVDNSHISLVWQQTGPGIGGGGGSVAIGPDGRVYSTGSSAVWEMDPATGTVLRSIPGFAFSGTPALTNGVLWALENGHVAAFDLLTLQLLRSFNGQTDGSAYPDPGAFTDGYFLLDHGDGPSQAGFDVYRQVPEPTVLLLFVPAGVVMAASLFRRTWAENRRRNARSMTRTPVSF